MNQNFYVCRPKKQSTPAILFCLCVLICSVVSFYLAVILPALRAFGQFLSVLLILLFVQITTKFLLTEYYYQWENDRLFVTSRVGKKEKNLGSLFVTPECRLIPKKEWKKALANRECSPSRQRFSYCQNLFAKGAFVLVCPKEAMGEDCALIFEPDEVLVGLLKGKIGVDQDNAGSSALAKF